MLKLARGFLLVICLATGAAAADPIRLAPSNPHYYFYKGKPVLLITSAEHYGAVINRDFDYVAYLDALQAHGLNYTRFYLGAMFEPAGKFMAGNTLGPRPAIRIPMKRINSWVKNALRRFDGIDSQSRTGALQILAAILVAVWLYSVMMRAPDDLFSTGGPVKDAATAEE